MRKMIATIVVTLCLITGVAFAQDASQQGMKQMKPGMAKKDTTMMKGKSMKHSSMDHSKMMMKSSAKKSMNGSMKSMKPSMKDSTKMQNKMMKKKNDGEMK